MTYCGTGRRTLGRYPAALNVHSAVILMIRPGSHVPVRVRRCLSRNIA